MQDISYRVINDFSDISLEKKMWDRLLEKGPTDEVFLTKEWLQTWWEVYGRGKLLIVLVEINNKPVAIAPMFADSGMVYFIGSGGSDYLDFTGNIYNIEILKGILNTAAAEVNDFLGFLFYHIPEESESTSIIKQLEGSKDWRLFNEGSLEAPFLDITSDFDWSESLLRKKSLRRHENYYLRNGGIEVFHHTSKNEILGLLDEFFEQHILRWGKTEFPSLFLDEQNKGFYTKLAEIADKLDWLVFTAIRWNDRFIAFHFGFEYKKTFMWYKPSFDVALSKHSPGEVLIGNLLKASINKNDLFFDLGLGKEPFKYRFANNTRMVKNWGIYPANLNV